MDVLPLGTRSDLLWSMGPYSPDFYKFSISRTPEQIKTAVFESRRVQYIIEKVRKLYVSCHTTRNMGHDTAMYTVVTNDL